MKEGWTHFCVGSALNGFPLILSQNPRKELNYGRSVLAGALTFILLCDHFFLRNYPCRQNDCKFIIHNSVTNCSKRSTD